MPFSASAITRASAGGFGEGQPHVAVEGAQPDQPVGGEPRLLHGHVADAGLEPERPAHPHGVNRPAPHLGRERAGEIGDVEAALGDVQPLDADGARHLEPDRRLEPRVGARLHDRHAEPARPIRPPPPGIGSDRRAAGALRTTSMATSSRSAPITRTVAIDASSVTTAPAGRAIRRVTRSVTSAAAGGCAARRRERDGNHRPGPTGRAPVPEVAGATRIASPN